jgi:hypothetical protein
MSDPVIGRRRFLEVLGEIGAVWTWTIRRPTQRVWPVPVLIGVDYGRDELTATVAFVYTPPELIGPGELIWAPAVNDGPFPFGFPPGTLRIEEVRLEARSCHL